MAEIKERFFIKILPELPCSVLKLSTGTPVKKMANL
jgi:hypothetical protein